ncbi:hypothetical protein B0H63DRAFT_399935 [Podospora didyma]|uniref:C2H2-type domain-containing protein n=1 Tax=Podospora didyma TaxID=330526 RepID=A0AAE0N1T8_9PEZI|nr:hypothetical protein B0H63DRAFT_405570 [Podospora didyma]KAK3375216.1 hypothetical protein B0H63DRAFT_399935 [Podospora didyma]
MSTTAAPDAAHGLQTEIYDPDDDWRPMSTPPLKPHRPRLELSPSPPLLFDNHKVSPPPSSGPKKSNVGRMKPKPTQGDVALVNLLGDGRNPDLGAHAGTTMLPDIDGEPDPGASSDSSEDTVDCAGGQGSSARGGGGQDSDRSGGAGQPELDGQEMMSVDSPSQVNMGAFDLKALAADAMALAAFGTPDTRPDPVHAGPTPPVTENDVMERPPPAPIPPAITTRQAEPARDERLIHPSIPSPYSPYYSPRDQIPQTNGIQSPTAGLSSSRGEGLAPLQLNSPRSETSGQTPLPSLTATFGDFRQLKTNYIAENHERLRNSHHSFPHSPPSLPRLGMRSHHASPPISPAETFRRDPISPGQFYPPSSAHPPYEYASSATETPGSERSGSTNPAVGGKMSIDSASNQPGIYVCKFDGCGAPPFQTQYLLNSHANVHSSARPHYCPMPGCPRSEGGRGFKRKNEMIRHGLVHDSPGYVCPFCPDREHKYPRPDNLQRHVRAHHVDKDKDDPLLRDVLAQRPDGPNRGRRRRGPGG